MLLSLPQISAFVCGLRLKVTSREVQPHAQHYSRVIVWITPDVRDRGESTRAEEYVGHSVGECNVHLKYFVTLFDSMNG